MNAAALRSLAHLGPETRSAGRLRASGVMLLQWVGHLVAWSGVRLVWCAWGGSLVRIAASQPVVGQLAQSARPWLRAGHSRLLSLSLTLPLTLALAPFIVACDAHDYGAANAPGEPMKPGTSLGGPGNGPGLFSKPRAIDTDGTHLVVIDRSGRVQVIDPNSGRGLAFWRLPDMSGGFPTGVTVAPSPTGDGTTAVWIADTHNHRVSVYAMPTLDNGAWLLAPTNPALLLRFGGIGDGPGKFTYPSDIAVLTGPDGKSIDRVYVSEFGGHDRVSIFTLSSTPAGELAAKFVSSFGVEGPPSDTAITFQRPQGMNFLNLPVGPRSQRRTRLLLSDSINHRLGVFELDGALVRWFDTPGQFLHPRGIEVLADGSALVVEFGRNRVQRIDTQTGATLGVWGRAGRGLGELAEPWTLCSVGGVTFVVDALNHRLVRMQTPRPDWRPASP